MTNNNVSYSLMLEAPWKKYDKVDVTNVLEALKMMQEIDDGSKDKSEAFMAMEHVLRHAEGMSAVFKESEADMRLIGEQQNKSTGWRRVAKMTREHAKRHMELRRMCTFVMVFLNKSSCLSSHNYCTNKR
jgi:hypothetical protein